MKNFETQKSDAQQSRPSHERPSRPSATSISHGRRWQPFYRAELARVRAEEFPSVPPTQWGWYDFLSPHPWTWFVTLTFASPIHPEQAGKRWARWINALERHSSRRPKLTPVIWARGDERQSRGVLHYHALVGNVLGVPEVTALRLWERLGGGFGRITPYDRSRLGALYIAKDGNVGLSDAWWALRHDSGSLPSACPLCSIPFGGARPSLP
jgi:hypothetical protein